MIATGYLPLGGAVSLNGAFAKMSAALEFIFFCLGLASVVPGLGLAQAVTMLRTAVDGKASPRPAPFPEGTASLIKPVLA